MEISLVYGAHLATQILVLGWTMPFFTKVNKPGRREVTIRMFWCAFFQKKNSRGASIPDWRVTVLTSADLVAFAWSPRCNNIISIVMLL